MHSTRLDVIPQVDSEKFVPINQIRVEIFPESSTRWVWWGVSLEMDFAAGTVDEQRDSKPTSDESRF